ETEGDRQLPPRGGVEAEQTRVGGRWGPLPGLSTRINNPAGLWNRIPSPTPVTISELGHATRRSVLRTETPNGSTVQGEPTGAWRDRKGSWTKPKPRVMPGIRG